MRVEPRPGAIRGLVDLRDAAVLRALGVPQEPERYLDRELARSVAATVRSDERHAGIIVPSMAFLDRPDAADDRAVRRTDRRRRDSRGCSPAGSRWPASRSAAPRPLAGRAPARRAPPRSHVQAPQASGTKPGDEQPRPEHDGGDRQRDPEPEGERRQRLAGQPARARPRTGTAPPASSLGAVPRPLPTPPRPPAAGARPGQRAAARTRRAARCRRPRR